MAQYIYTMNRVAKVVPPKRYLIRDISLSFFPGAKIGVLGLNGSGKSTLMRIMAGLDTEIDGEARPQPGIKIGYLPQEASVFRNLTVEQNILAILETHQELDRQSRRDRCDELLAEFGISHLRESLAMSLSGGERRRLEIAKALLHAPIVV